MSPTRSHRKSRYRSARERAALNRPYSARHHAEAASDARRGSRSTRSTLVTALTALRRRGDPNVREHLPMVPRRSIAEEAGTRASVLLELNSGIAVYDGSGGMYARTSGRSSIVHG
jgi:hypothetical protein